VSAVYTVLHVYKLPMRRWRCPVPKWIAVPKPVAELEPDLPEEEKDVDGNVITHFKSKFGVRFARVVEPSGFVLWLQEVP
jgi:hypothetical protein